MAKTYWFKFGSSNSASFSGLSPTFVLFQTEAGSTMIPPGVTERIAGTGAYQFLFPGSTLSVFFRIDGGNTLSSTDRYIHGVLDPVQSVDQRLGYTTDSYGDNTIDPTTALGYLKRLQEILEGNAIFTKSSGTWTVQSRGSTTTLAVKSLTNTATAATKT